MGIGMGLKGLLLLWPDPQGPQPWARVPRYVPGTGVKPALTMYSEQEFLVVKKTLLTMNFACARKSCSKCYHTDLLNSHLQAMSPYPL